MYYDIWFNTHYKQLVYTVLLMAYQIQLATFQTCKEFIMITFLTITYNLQTRYYSLNWDINTYNLSVFINHNMVVSCVYL